MEDLALPELSRPRDAILRVTRAAICGTDLHPYRGEISKFRPGTLMGHEFTGIVEATGEAVENVRSGERAIASDLIACGRCWFCRRNWHYQCEHVGLFGYDRVVGTTYIPGGQAEYVRVPYADVVLSKIPAKLSDEQVLFVGDVFTTGFTCAQEAGVSRGETVAVIGCGAVGLFAMMSAQLLGAERLLAIDPNLARRNLAAELGGYSLAPGANLVRQVRKLTAGVGPDVVLEAVGSDTALRIALEIVRAKGTICSVGAHASEVMPFPTKMAFDRELTLRFAVGDPIRSRPDLIPLLEDGRLDTTLIISHRLKLSEAPEGYRLFDRGEATKVVLLP